MAQTEDREEDSASLFPAPLPSPTQKLLPGPGARGDCSLLPAWHWKPSTMGWLSLVDLLLPTGGTPQSFDTSCCLPLHPCLPGRSSIHLLSPLPLSCKA